jgi:phosphoribosylaminoimidazole-succinocarboxamide synthase
MEELDLEQPAIVFWTHHPGEITRFDRLEDAVHSIMLTPSTKLFSIAWIKARDRHIEMEEIRQIARRSILSHYLANP